MDYERRIRKRDLAKSWQSGGINVQLCIINVYTNNFL